MKVTDLTAQKLSEAEARLDDAWAEVARLEDELKFAQERWWAARAEHERLLVLVEEARP